jgi:hypothetical protein
LRLVSYRLLKLNVEHYVPEGPFRGNALKRIERLDPTKAVNNEDQLARVWADLERSSPAADVYRVEFAKQWKQIGCAAPGAPYVLMGLIRSIEQTALVYDPQVPLLAAEFLREDCAGARGLSDEEKHKLSNLRDRSLQK